MPLGMEVSFGPDHIVLDGDPAPDPQKRSTAPQFAPHFSAHIHCGQTAAWIKMPLGMEAGLGPCHIVLGGDPAPPKKGGELAPYLTQCGRGRGLTPCQTSPRPIQPFGHNAPTSQTGQTDRTGQTTV